MCSLLLSQTDISEKPRGGELLVQGDALDEAQKYVQLRGIEGTSSSMVSDI